MSDEEVVVESSPVEKDAVIGEIHIKVTEKNVSYESELSVPEVVFWMDIAKTMILGKLVNN